MSRIPRSMQSAQSAIDALFSDTTVSRSATAQMLEELAADIESKLEALSEDALNEELFDHIDHTSEYDDDE